jgi:hypothetical protein
LIDKFSFNSSQALDHHLTPLRQYDLIDEVPSPDGPQTFEASRLVRRLPKTVLDNVLKE